MVALDNPCDECIAAAPQPWAPAAGPAAAPDEQQQPLLPPLPACFEDRLRQLVGPPHNYEGFRAEASGPPNCAAAAGSAQPTLPGAQGAGLPTEAAAVEAEAAAQAALVRGRAAREWRARASARAAPGAAPLRAYLLASVVPPLTEALARCVVEQPERPLDVVVGCLLAAAAQQEAEWASPYNDPAYAAQEAKWEAKRGRDAARAEAARAKQERWARAATGARGDGAHERGRVCANAAAGALAALAAACTRTSPYATAARPLQGDARARRGCRGRGGRGCGRRGARRGPGAGRAARARGARAQRGAQADER